MDGKKRGKRAKGSVAPDENGFANSSFELHLDSDHNVKNNSKMLNTFRSKVDETNKKKNALAAIVEAKKGAHKWRQYCATKRAITKTKAQSKGVSTEDDGNQPGNKGQGLDAIDPQVLHSLNAGFKKKNSTMIASQTKALFDHFKELGRSKNADAVVDLEFISSLLRNGANINCSDRHGQTLLHEVARMWHVDIAKFLLDEGADINHPDHLGRTPLHVAAAVDYPEMCEVLMERGADKEAKTKGEMQTAVHFAAKNDAAKSLKTLIKRGCLYDGEHVLDYRQRTPLYVAAQLDRSESAQILLNNKASATTRDVSGQICLSWMIVKMPPVAQDALSQFWTCDRPNRKQYYDLHHMVHDKEVDKDLVAVTPLNAAVNYKQYDLLMNKTFIKLINTQWVRFARWRAWLNLFLNFVYILLWSLIGIFIEFDERHEYIMPEQWYRVVLWVAAIGFTTWQIIEEVLEYKRSLRKNYLWETTRSNEIDADLKYCHERWPEEKAFLISEKDELKNRGPSYFTDFWNIFDWTCYLFLMVCIATHIADVVDHKTDVARAHIRLMAVTIILLWLRLMKNVRCFSLLGPFIVMLTHMLKDLVRFTFLYLEFFIPFVFAFYMIFGGNKVAYSGNVVVKADNVTVSGYEDFNSALFSLFRLTMVDDYDFDNMLIIDPLMARLLVGLWLALSAVLCLNLFIALLSDTFQRVYDNAQANAMMQKAQSIISFWEGMSHSSRDKFLHYISANCSPLKQYYDDDMTDADGEDLTKVTIQIKEQLDDLEEKWSESFKPSGQKTLPIPKDEDSESNGQTVSVEKFENEVEDLHKGIRDLSLRQDDMMDSIKAIKRLLLRMTGQDESEDDDDDGDEGGDDDTPPKRSKGKSKPKKKEGQRRSRTPSSVVDGSAWEVTRPSGVSTPQVWSTGPVVDVSTPRFTSSGQFPGQDPTTEC
ncbi:transient receptor potential cation channel subfamily A member 1-like isoform X2 [Mytilus californianus]|uniref:transient receptor potential cation channel subfamily A member 1-like isoform X2 n=1 Tax=Mytilus californianus TaxID=6549 RepID=UPI002247F5A6|nr:transient receptor potential cation channel subfamily A member 1-like isoform X2 [Mytilus californianus]